MEARELGRQGKHRRGGGGAATGLPEALPVSVACEADLRVELERLTTQLVPAVDWTQRVDALLRLEGLILGGATNFAAFPELLLGTRDALSSQMQERRSAVSRQACHAVAVLAAACGHDFEPLAVHLLPVVFKTLAMGIQVVSELAEVCAYAMLAACPSPRLLPKLCTLVAGDRNGRLRQSAAEFLLRALEWWEPADYERQLEAVERAVLAAVQDAQSETRAVGRCMYNAFAHAWPSQAYAMLSRLGQRDKQLQEKLAAAAAEYVPAGVQPVSRRTSNNGSEDAPAGGASQSSLSSHRSLPSGGAVRLAPAAVPKLALSLLPSTGAAESARSSPCRPSSARSLAPIAASMTQQAPLPVWQQPAAVSSRENQPDNRGPAPVQPTPRSMFPKTKARREAAAAASDVVEPEPEPARQVATAAQERLVPRRSMGGAALRMSIASFRRPQEPSDEAAEAAWQPDTAAAAPPQRSTVRVPLPPLPLPQPAEVQLHPEVAFRPPTARRQCGLERQASGVPECAEVGSLASSWDEASTVASAAPSLAPLLAGLSQQGVTWSDRVGVFHSVQAAMERSGSHSVAADVASNADRLVASLLEGAGDAHFRVAAAALAALGEGLASPCTRVFEPQLDRVMTALFARVADPKEQIRGLVSAALSAVLLQHNGEVVVAALTRSLQANRAPRVKCAVMDYFAAAARGGGAAGASPDDSEHEPSPGLLHQLAGTALAALLRVIMQLATDKNPDIRRAAADAVAAAYHAGGAQTVLGALHSLPPADLLAVQRAIGPAIQQQQPQQSQQAAACEVNPTAHAVPLTASPAAVRPGVLTSRRQSVEGAPCQHAALGHESSGSLTARSRHGSQRGSPAPSKLQSAPAAAAEPGPPGAAAPSRHLTPQPPSPFMWRTHSVSPLGPAAAEASSSAAAAASGAEHVQQQQVQPASQPSNQLAHPPRAHELLDAAPDAEPAALDGTTTAQLQSLLDQLAAGPSSDSLQDLSRMVQGGLPATAWPHCFDALLAGVCNALSNPSPVLREAGLLLARDLGAAAHLPLLQPALPSLLGQLLACAADQLAGEVALAADEALEALLLRAPPQGCLEVLLPRLPSLSDQLSTDRQQGAELLAALRSVRRVAARTQPAVLSAHLQPLLMPRLCIAYGSPLTDLRKATVDCLVSIWQVVGSAIKPHLAPLSASQLKLLEIYCSRAASRTA